FSALLPVLLQLLGVQTQSHIGKIIISKLTYKLGGLLLLSPIGFRMEPQLGLYVRLGEMLGLGFQQLVSDPGRRYEKGGIVAIVEGEAHGALGLRGGLLGVQTQSHIGKIIISKLTYKLGGLLLLSPIGFRMEPQLGLYVRLGEILGLRFPTIGIRARLGPVEAGKKAGCSDGKGRRYEKGGIVAIVEGEAHGALGLRGGLLGVQTQSHIGKIIISKLTYKLGGLLLLSPIGFRMEPQLGLYVRLGEILGLRFPTIGIRARLGPVVVWMVFPWLDPGRRYEKGRIVAIVEGEAHGALGFREGLFLAKNTMAEQNVPTQPSTRTNEQIVPRSQWLIIRKSNLLFNFQKIQKNPIFQISVDILSNSNFFRAFTASTSVHAIYLQQFWNIMKYDEKTGVYRCQIDEQWFDLSADLLRKALAITPVIPAQPFELPPSGNTVIDFVNKLGYPEPVEIVSNIRVNYVYQPWRAILTLINQCLTGKTSGSDKPRHPVLQMLWGIVTQTNVDHAELLWEEFTQGIQTFFSHKASHKASLKDPKKKVTPLLIPYGRFSKFVPKGESVEVFGMAILDPLITEAIQQSSYYPKYLEIVADNTMKTPQESASVQPATKHAPPKKTITTTPVKQSKPAPAPTKKPSKHKLPQKVRKGKPTYQLVDEDDEAQQEFVPQEEGDDPDLELAKKMSLEAHQEKGEGEGDDADMERAIKLSLDPAFLPQGRAPVGGVTIRDPVSETTPKLPEVVGKGKAIVTEEQVAHSLIDLSKKKRTTDQFILVRRDQTPHDSTTGPSSQPEDDTSEKVIHESSSTSDSERTESETEAAAPKGNKDQGEVDSSRVTSGVSIPVSTQGQAGSDPEKAHEALADTNLSHARRPDWIKLWKSTSTTITTSLPEITPFIALQLRVARLEQEMSEVKKTDHSADVLASIKSQVPTVVDKYLGTKLDDALLKILERHTADLIEKYSVLPGPESIKNQESEKSPKEIIRIKREKGEEKQDSTYSIKSTDKVDLEEFDLKSALFKHMNKNKSANRNPANYHLYHALMEALIADEDAMDKEVKDRVKNHKRKHDSDNDEDDDDDEGPSAGSNQQSSKKPRESDASASKQHPALTSTGWQITDTRDAVVDSSMPRSDTESEHSEQSSDDIPMQDEGHVSDLEDHDNAHIQEPENNWANTYATTYKAPAENKLQRKMYDIGSFIKWFCRRT
ncbi:hypothetical protein Tco_0167617, partial [Tanacetum coccineum]